MKGGNDLIDLNAINDINDENILTAQTNINDQINLSEKQNLSLKLNTSESNYTILSEELDVQNLPASPPFTKVSSIKMFKSNVKSKNQSTPLRLSATKVVKPDVNKIKSSDEVPRSLLPRMKKRTVKKL